MDLSLLKSLPIGLLLFVGSYLVARRRKSGRSKATQQLPLYAQSLGLRHHPPHNAGDVGVLSGRYEGYEVRVDPDEFARINLKFERSHAVELRSFPFFKRPPQGLEPWLTPFRQFNSYFVDRFASDAVSEQILSLGNLDQAVLQLKGSPQRIASFSVSSDGIECRLVIDRVSYISSETLQYLLPVLLQWARAIDPPRSTGEASTT